MPYSKRTLFTILLLSNSLIHLVAQNNDSISLEIIESEEVYRFPTFDKIIPAVIFRVTNNGETNYSVSTPDTGSSSIVFVSPEGYESYFHIISCPPHYYELKPGHSKEWKYTLEAIQIMLSASRARKGQTFQVYWKSGFLSSNWFSFVVD